MPNLTPRGSASRFRAPNDPELTFSGRGDMGPPGTGCQCQAPPLAASLRHSPLPSPFFLISHQKSRRMTQRRV